MGINKMAASPLTISAMCLLSIYLIQMQFLRMISEALVDLLVTENFWSVMRLQGERAHRVSYNQYIVLDTT